MQNQLRPEAEQTYTVLIRPVHNALQKKSLEEALARIETMTKKLDHFYNTIAMGYKEASDLLLQMQTANIIKEEPSRDRTDQSVATYLELLLAIKEEIERERVVLKIIQATETEQTIEIYEPAPANFDDFLSQKVRNTKAQTKKIESSLRISFSRYQHWISQTLTRLYHLQKTYSSSVA